MTRLDSVVVTLATLCLVTAQSNSLVSQLCLGCICEASSSCDTSRGCVNGACGPFQIQLGYWTDAGKPTVNNESAESVKAHAKCASDIYCSAQAVQGYMNKYQTDCNNDSKTDCDDFAAIHRLGGYGCKDGTITGIYAQRYQKCKVLFLVNQP